MSLELNIAGINTLAGLIERLPLGQPAQDLAKRLAVWTTSAHQNLSAERKVYPRTLSNLTEGGLSDTYAYWNAELIRLHELHGLLEGQRKYVELLVKKERAHARSAVRQKYEEDLAAAGPDVKVSKPTAGEINDRAEDSEAVLAAVESLGLLDVVMSSVLGYREACITATASLSREISFRQAQYTARLR